VEDTSEETFEKSIPTYSNYKGRNEVKEEERLSVHDKHNEGDQGQDNLCVLCEGVYHL
jgi:hypothetical protein